MSVQTGRVVVKSDGRVDRINCRNADQRLRINDKDVAAIGRRARAALTDWAQPRFVGEYHRVPSATSDLEASSGGVHDDAHEIVLERCGVREAGLSDVVPSKLATPCATQMQRTPAVPTDSSGERGSVSSTPADSTGLQRERTSPCQGEGGSPQLMRTDPAALAERSAEWLMRQGVRSPLKPRQVEKVFIHPVSIAAVGTIVSGV